MALSLRRVHGTLRHNDRPATELVAARVPDADEADVDRAGMRAAREAWPAWRRLAPGERARLVRDLGRAVLERREEFAFLDALDGGFPISSMRNDVAWAAELTELFANSAMALGGETVPASAEHLHYTTRHPFGVVGRIVPFNHPLFFAVGKVAAPLVAGNTVVLKPAEQTPLSALRFGELAADMTPSGAVFDVVTGLGPGVGRALVAHPEVRRLAFIGSDAVGRAIQREAAQSGVKNITLELGGKNAMLVLPGADLERAAEGVVKGMNFVGAAGQSCGSNFRVLVHRDLKPGLRRAGRGAGGRAADRSSPQRRFRSGHAYLRSSAGAHRGIRRDRRTQRRACGSRGAAATRVRPRLLLRAHRVPRRSLPARASARKRYSGPSCRS